MKRNLYCLETDDGEMFGTAKQLESAAGFDCGVVRKCAAMNKSLPDGRQVYVIDGFFVDWRAITADIKKRLTREIRLVPGGELD